MQNKIESDVSNLHTCGEIFLGKARHEFNIYKLCLKNCIMRKVITHVKELNK